MYIVYTLHFRKERGFQHTHTLSLLSTDDDLAQMKCGAHEAYTHTQKTLKQVCAVVRLGHKINSKGAPMSRKFLRQFMIGSTYYGRCTKMVKLNVKTHCTCLAYKYSISAIMYIIQQIYCICSPCNFQQSNRRGLPTKGFTTHATATFCHVCDLCIRPICLCTDSIVSECEHHLTLLPYNICLRLLAQKIVGIDRKIRRKKNNNICIL